VTADPLLAVEELHTYYGDNHVLHGVSLTIPAGEVTAILGRNGMGKTTLIRSIIGFTPPRRGRVLFRGRPIQQLPSHEIARQGIGLVPQGRRIFASLTVEEQLRVVPRGGGDWTLERVYGLFPRLKERRGHFGGQLSGGEQQMLAIGRALMTNPALLLMDEPSEGLAPVIIERVGEILADLRRGGLSIFLVEQNYGLATALADTIYILSNGRVVWQGTPGELEESASVRETYLGV